VVRQRPSQGHWSANTAILLSRHRKDIFSAEYTFGQVMASVRHHSTQSNVFYTSITSGY